NLLLDLDILVVTLTFSLHDSLPIALQTARRYRSVSARRTTPRAVTPSFRPARSPGSRTSRPRPTCCPSCSRRRSRPTPRRTRSRSEEHTSELQSRDNLVCRLLLEKK